MKIGMVSKFLPEQDGIARFTTGLCEELEKSVEVVRIGDVKSSANYNVDFQAWNLKEQLEKIIRREKVDVLHVQYIAAYFGKKTLNLNLLRALNQSIPVVLSLHEVHDGSEKLAWHRKKLLMWLEKKVAQKSSAAFAHSPAQATLLSKRSGRNVEATHLGIAPKKASKGSSILYLGIISENKGVDLLIEAARQFPNEQFVIVGKATNQLQTRIEHAAKQLKNVTLRLEWVSDTEREDYLKSSKIVVLPYLQAPNQSGILMDAVAFGKVVVVTNRGHPHEYVSKYHSGAVVEATSAGITTGIRDVLQNPHQYHAGLKAFQKDASWNEIAKQHIETYKNI